jgi:hypothetical protein
MTQQSAKDNLLAGIRWDARSNWWRGSVDLTSFHAIEVCISVAESDYEQVIERVGELCLVIRKNELSYRESAAEALLSLHNDTWNEGEPISRAEFISRMKMESMVVSSDGESGLVTELYYDDGDLFWGHVIAVSLTEEGHFEAANIAG